MPMPSTRNPETKKAGQRSNADTGLMNPIIHEGKFPMIMDQKPPTYNPPSAAPMDIDSVRDSDRDRMTRVIEQLEAWQPWEPSSTAAAKVFAAGQMRKALGLELPDPGLAEMHLAYQQLAFEAYCRSDGFDVARAELRQIGGAQ